jgi:uncharacterized membrane protein YeiB
VRVRARQKRYEKDAHEFTRLQKSGFHGGEIAVGSDVLTFFFCVAVILLVLFLRFGSGLFGRWQLSLVVGYAVHEPGSG